MIIYLVCCFIFSLYAIKAFRYNFTNISPWCYVRIVLASPLILPIQLINLIRIKWFWSKRTPKDKSLKTSTKFVHSKIQEIFDIDFLFNYNRNSLSMAIYRYTLTTFDPCCVGSFVYEINRHLHNLYLLLPWNRYAHFVGQRFIHNSSTKLLNDYECRTYGPDIKYYTYKVCFGRLTITETRFVDTEDHAKSTYLNMFIGEDLTKKSKVIFSKYIFTKRQAIEAFKTFLENTELFTIYSFAQEPFAIENLIIAHNLLTKDTSYNYKVYDSDLTAFKHNNKATILGYLYFYQSRTYNSDINCIIAKSFYKDFKGDFKETTIETLAKTINNDLNKWVKFDIYYSKI